MKQLNWYQIFGNTHKIPDGRTVLPTDDIQIWLNCANIWNKTYTTLAEVLTDTTCLNNLMASDNAADYLVRSTLWVSGITTNSDAMTYIGQNNYCANTLLADATWCNAICNSEYFESVLNVKVPTMTSNTTPSGECIASSYYPGQENYKAFDGDATTTWSSLNNNFNGIEYVGYGFTEAKKIYCAKFKERALGGYGEITAEIKYQGSDDKGTWTDISSSENIKVTTHGTQEVHTTILENSNYRYLIVRYLSRVTGDTRVNPTVAELQFYGREDV